MLLGAVPAEMVRSILEPFLDNFWDFMLQLPSGLQADLENILRIYPDVAADFGLRMKLPIKKMLSQLAKHLKEKAGLPDVNDLDLAAEKQEGLYFHRLGKVEGQGFFRTDSGNSVYLAFSFTDGADFVIFSRKPAIAAIEIKIGGKQALAMQPGQSEKSIGIEELLDLKNGWISQETGETSIECVEK